MRIRAGYEISYNCMQPTPMLLVLSVHPSRLRDIDGPHRINFSPLIGATEYRDLFGNICHRIIAPPGRLTISTGFVISDSGMPDAVVPEAKQHPVEELPDETLVFLLGSRYCETDRLSDLAWSLFGGTPPGWARVQAICDYAHNWITFNYQHADATRSAWSGHSERIGVCRDFAHLAITLCRCMNIPARYCTGYLGEFGVPVGRNPMDFSGWFEAYLDNGWHVFDARHNVRRIGRIKIAHGRDAADVAISNTFGPNRLVTFKVWSDDVTADGTLPTADIYQSSNGDRWRLVRDTASGRDLVQHEANAASGGHTSVSSIGAFLETGGSGPEHAALRKLIGIRQ